MRHVVVVGASLAGLRTSEALRRHGHRGRITIVGAEPQLPYDRPPLSKALLTGRTTADRLQLPRATELEADFVLGVRAVSLDRDGREIGLANGRKIPYDGLVIATGARAAVNGARAGTEPRPWTLRSLADAVALRDRLVPRQRIRVVGGGFLGNEIAAAARQRGCEVELVTRGKLPLLAAAGEPVATLVAELHRRAGVTLHMKNPQSPADVTIAAIGAKPNVEWLSGAGLQLDNGLLCDRCLRPITQDGEPVSNIVAAGDVVRWPHSLAGGSPITVGHWSNAVDQAEIAARNLLFPDRPLPFTAVPSYWSDLYDARLRAIGLPHLGSPVVEEHDPTAMRLVVTYWQDSELVGAITINRTSRLAPYRTALAKHHQVGGSETDLSCGGTGLSVR
ncbi:NAD(P)/FAD-dependent oxidoreductase [Kribbella sp. CA-294648]|uniref:NAD(P)/FAD-dependent oxidoreductase n=1 Tax=Kribbella sp. CA-294648 TaxID=3239948 RepID=UPI003D8DE452